MADRKPDIAGKRLSKAEYAANFADLHPPLGHHEALVESDRCYFCYDAPCMQACPTSIDIPLFIRQIQAGHAKSAAKTIFDQNIFGGMCARVCPTETLCEEVCVRQVAEGKPVKIGLLQRHATDQAMAEGTHPYSREQGAAVLSQTQHAKYWPPVGRVDNVWGDRNLSCSCIPVSDYA